MSSGARHGALSVQNRPSEQPPKDPDLAKLIEAWPQLSEDARAAILREAGL
jgi:hypothetical protein